jgi:hypothetical protein
VPESDGVSDGAWSRQTLLFRLFEGPRRAFDASRQVLDLVACLYFLFLSCFKIFFVRRARYFLCCSTTRIWI